VGVLQVLQAKMASKIMDKVIRRRNTRSSSFRQRSQVKDENGDQSSSAEQEGGTTRNVFQRGTWVRIRIFEMRPVYFVFIFKKRSVVGQTSQIWSIFVHLRLFLHSSFSSIFAFSLLCNRTSSINKFIY
jgi:hypothetical protein